MSSITAGEKGYKGVAMEGPVARRYAKLRRSGNQLEDWKNQALQLTRALPNGADILEVAPGPGYFAIEMARIGRFHVTGLDISRTFVQIEEESARAAGVSATFRLGDASNMPFADGSFDLVVCQAAFKNFRRPDRAIDEMHRVLREGGTAVIQDMRKDAPDGAIREEVRGMGLGPVGAFLTRRILSGLRRRAYSSEQLEQMANRSPFGRGEIATSGIGVELRLKKRGSAT